MMDITDDKLQFYYEDEHPLESFHIKRTPKNDVICHNHNRRLKECFSIIVHFEFIIPERDFTYKDFFSLHKMFRRLISVYR